MTSRKIDSLLLSIKKQIEYDYKIVSDKERISNNIKNYQDNKNRKEKIKLKRIENIDNNLTNIDYQSKNPLESVKYDSNILIPIYKDDTYDYINKYNFNRKKIINQNEKNRIRTNKNMDLKLYKYSFNKIMYINNIKNIFSVRNELNRKKTEKILENKKISNNELKKSINMKHAYKYDKYMDYLKYKNIENKRYNDILNYKIKLAQDKYNVNVIKKLNEIKKSIKNTEFNHKINNKNIRNIIFEDINKKILLSKNIIKEKEEKNKEAIIEKEKKYFLKSKQKQDEINDKKNKAKQNEQINIKINEIKLNEAKAIYNQIFKNEIIYKKEKL